ncbi:TetR/AcrR family transcriptional regulator [Actinomadura vinacea]|uniref:TetR/AcrR family transcriptional regulator n=1 Tax=Actinomadura vinacea TaxID=115336 RepID=A0ABP5VFX5_9ACTN
MGAEDVAPELVRLWRLPAGSRMGRPAELDVERVVRAAVALADEGGLAKATLPKVAEALGYTTMSLYRHVGSKDELLSLMRDQALGPAPAPRADGLEWRAGLREWALAQAAIYWRHPWLVRLPISSPPRGPNEITWLDAGLRILRETGLDWPRKLGVIGLLAGQVRSACQQALDLADGRRDGGLDQHRAEQDYGRTMARLVDAVRCPEAAAMFASGLFEPPPVQETDEPIDADFTFGLDLILDGVATMMATKPAGDRGGGGARP